MQPEKRRSFLKKLGLSLASVSVTLPGSSAGVFRLKDDKRRVYRFKDGLIKVNDRTWIGERFWAIPMEDWEVKQGRIQFSGQEKLSRVNILTAVIPGGAGELTASIETGLIKELTTGKDGSVGFLIGIKDELDPDVKAACYFGKGIPAGISTKGFLFLNDKQVALPAQFNFSSMSLEVRVVREEKSTSIDLTCKDDRGNQASVRNQSEKDIAGLVAIATNFQSKGGEAFWFRNLNLQGSKLTEKRENTFGPILWSMYTLSKGVLRIGAQLPPLGKNDNKTVSLYLKSGKQWNKVASQPIDDFSWTAHFQLDGWDSKKEVPFKLVYQNNGEEFTRTGTIRREPDTTLRFGGLTCQESDGFPYTPLVKNLERHNPDMLFFSGDQLYEGNGGYPNKREPESKAVLSYLGKWYMFGWAFGNIMRDRPTICTPDDHDVFHGNLWGEGGETISIEKWRKVADAHGGYVQTPGFVNMVATTQCGHMPEPFHTTPLPSGIKSWHTDLLYGRISFAIISDRMFKSGPEMIRKGGGRIDFVPIQTDEVLDDPKLELLGSQQMEFLEQWTNDWAGADMKVLLSQTLFASVNTHHGPKREVRGDLDSDGWPKQKRDDAIRLMRKASVFHINGDQHLPFIVQYNADDVKDGGWAFCTPAISVGYPRWGQPDLINLPYTDRPAHNLPNTGVYEDTFGSKNFIYAVGNPKDEPTRKNRYLRAQEKASGFGLITFNTNDRTIRMEAFRFLANKDKPTADDIFPGWPLTITQFDNDGRKPAAFLPRVEINKPDQVVKVIDEQNNEVVSVVRIKGTSYQPVVFNNNSVYSLVIGEAKASRTLKNLKPDRAESQKTLRISV